MAKTSKPTKKRVVKVEPLGRACIFASFNNVIISLTNNAGQVISWSSAGKMGFRGSKKSTVVVLRLPKLSTSPRYPTMVAVPQNVAACNY